MAPQIILRDVTQSDLLILFEQQLDPEATAMAAFPARDRDTFHAHWARVLADNSNIARTVVFDGQVAGVMMGFELDGQREVGYWIGREFWGKGIATRALTEFLDIEKKRPLHGHVARHNIASRRVLEKCGFKLAGEDEYINHGGQEVEEFILKLE